MTKQILACFDFDGTVTYSDSLLPFLIFSFGPISTFFHLFLEFPSFFLFLTGSMDRQEVKERVLKRFFGNYPIESVQELGKEYAHKKMPSLLKKEALAKIKNHKDKGHRLILISASIESYLIPWANLAGFDDVIASRLLVNQDGKVTGKLAGRNCRAEEKVRRLKELVGPLENYEIYAYGDSRGDKELLEAAAHPFYRKF